jgi:hypothetical protein
MPLVFKDSIDLPTLNEYILTGQIRIPEFQRSIIWQAEDVENVLDSINEGYPIGFFLFWTSRESLKERTPQPLQLKLRKIKKNEAKLWLLDGQQRATALIGSFTDNLFLGKGKNNKHRAFYDLREKKFRVLRVSDTEKRNPKPENKIEDWFIPLNKLFLRDKRKGEFILEKNKDLQIDPELEKKYSQHYNSEILHLWKMFTNLNIPVINEKKNLAEACEIFTRLNTAGTPLSVVDIMVAKTYDKDFVLREKIGDLDAELVESDFELKDTTILQCMAACVAKDTETETILDNAWQIRTEWDNTVNAVRLAVGFLKRTGGVCKISKLLPHEILLAPLSYFFYTSNRLKNEPQKGVELNNALKRFFWYNVLSEKYARSQSTKAREDMNEMDSLLAGNFNVFKPNDYDFTGFSDKNIKEKEISSTPFAKTVLCFLVSKTPKNYNDNSTVDVEKTINPQNLKSIHHIFPKTVYKEKLIDSVANISIIATSLNNKIRNERPKSYFAKFAQDNPNLEETLRDHHLIGDLDEFGINGDKFDIFIEKRSALIAQEMKKLIEELKPVSQASS